jgi:hypothetical protein
MNANCTKEFEDFRNIIKSKEYDEDPDEDCSLISDVSNDENFEMEEKERTEMEEKENETEEEEEKKDIPLPVDSTENEPNVSKSKYQNHFDVEKWRLERSERMERLEMEKKKEYSARMERIEMEKKKEDLDSFIYKILVKKFGCQIIIFFLFLIINKFSSETIYGFLACIGKISHQSANRLRYFNTTVLILYGIFVLWRISVKLYERYIKKNTKIETETEDWTKYDYISEIPLCILYNPWYKFFTLKEKKKIYFFFNKIKGSLVWV